MSKNDCGRNYGVALVFWDKLFRTFKAPSEKEIEFGISTNPYNKNSFFKYVWYSMQGAWRSSKR